VGKADQDEFPHAAGERRIDKVLRVDCICPVQKLFRMRLEQNAGEVDDAIDVLQTVRSEAGSLRSPRTISALAPGGKSKGRAHL
jgi:hypothetical protein